MGPAGFVQDRNKYIYNPTTQLLAVYDLNSDELELLRLELEEEKTNEIITQIIEWRRNSIFQLTQAHTGRTVLFDNWLCRWTGRISKAKYQTQTQEENLAAILSPEP